VEAQVRPDGLGWRTHQGRAGDFHLADLRHEAASRFDEAGMPINFVSKMLGHTNLLTTSAT